jgi:lactoylglutathione lyase
MTVIGLSHTGIQVTDVERSVAFYEKLGLELVARWTTCEPYVQRVVGYFPQVTLEVAVMAIPGSDTVLEVLEYRNVDRKSIDPDTGNVGTGHFCLLVDSVDDLYSRLASEGVEFVSSPQTPTAGPNTGGRLVYMKDPDGIRVELLETTRTMTGAPRN